MNTHHIETTIGEDGTLHLEGLPFQAGENVEIIILARSTKKAGKSAYPLQGTPIIYEDPTGPVALDDWEARK